MGFLKKPFVYEVIAAKLDSVLGEPSNDDL
jgi:hypothetical protein